MLRSLRKDYKNPAVDAPTRIEKRACYKLAIKSIFSLLWCSISAPLIYSIWYLFRKPITEKIHDEIPWQVVKEWVDHNNIKLVRVLFKEKGKFLYWLWTYGDLNDPLGRGGLPVDYKNGRNTFWNRFRYSALRNPRFNYNYVELRTARPIAEVTAINTRNFNYMHKSFGIGDSPDGTWLKWVLDEKGKWYFIYEDCNRRAIWYCGWVGLKDIDTSFGGRFEVSYRSTDSSYTLNKTYCNKC